MGKQPNDDKNEDGPTDEARFTIKADGSTVVQGPGGVTKTLSADEATDLSSILGVELSDERG